MCLMWSLWNKLTHYKQPSMPVFNRPTTLPLMLLPPANEVCEGYVFTGVCHSVHGGGHVWLLRGGMCGCSWGGMHGCSQGGHAWLLRGGLPRGGMRGCSWGGMCGCSGGACMVAPGGHAWLLTGGCAWLLMGVCVHGCSRGGHAWLLQGGHAWLLGGACMVALGGHAWLLWGGACVVAPGGHGFFDEIRSMSGRYTSYWNAFLFC